MPTLDTSWVRFGGWDTLHPAERHRRGTVVRHSPSGGDDALYVYLRNASGTYDIFPLTSSGAAARIGRFEYPLVTNGTTDNRTNLLAAIAKADALGGGTVYLPEGRIAFTGLLDIPNGVNLWGEGAGETSAETGTWLVALGATAQIRFGTTSGQYGGVSGNFTVDGDNLATDPFYVGLSEGRTFDTIRVIDAAAGGNAFTLAATQNCNFRNIKVNNNRGNGLVFDLGCGGNNIFGLACHTNSDDGVKFTQSDTSPAGAHPYPSDNRIYGFMIEHSSNPNAGKSLVYHGAGLNNGFIGGTFSMTGASAARNIITFAKEAEQLSEGLLLDSVWWAGNQTHTTAIDLVLSTGCSLAGRHRASLLLRFFHAADGSLVNNNAEFGTLAAVTNWFVSPTATVFAENTIVRHRSRSPLQILRATSSETVLTAGVDGESVPRIVIDGNGTVVWGSGSAAADTNLYRSAVDTLKTDDSLVVAGNSTLGNGNNDLAVVTGRFKIDGGTFTVTKEAGAGTTGTAARVKGSDSCGEVTITTGGAGIGAGVLATVNFAQARPDTNYEVFFQSASINASDLNWNVQSRLTSGFEMRANVTPGSGETLIVQFLVVEVKAP